MKMRIGDEGQYEKQESSPNSDSERANSSEGYDLNFQHGHILRRSGLVSDRRRECPMTGDPSE